ncbi:tRNA (guanosine(46)-N7)-methyltransferase TrmB [Pseudomonadales bacterium]|nr:tRNA (guanosine(46)-N7)-methyltransferase TrmB [Pseudomonadales bacterium]
MTTPIEPKRSPIRSFVIRQGRLSKGQRRGLEEIYPQFELKQSALAAPQSAYPINQPLTLEVGFGMGDSLAEMAVNAPERNFLGLEVHGPGVGHLMIQAANLGLTNLRVLNSDVWSVLPSLPAASLACFQIFFPDPWHKKRHHKRRLINAVFLDAVAEKLQPGGMLHIATDWQPYAEEIYDHLESHPAFSHCPAPARAETKYERRGQRLGHVVTDLAAQVP